MGKIAFRLAELIGDLDERVFGKKKAANIAIIWGEQKKKFCPVAELVVGTKRRRDCYLILKEIELVKKGMFQMPKKRNLSLTLDHLFVLIAAHEVRHRVQEWFSIRDLFSPKDEKIRDAYLRTLILDHKEYLNKLSKRMPLIIKMRNKTREFDAWIIGWWAVEIWNETKDISKVANIIAINPIFIRKKGRNYYSPRFFTYSFSISSFKNFLFRL